MAIKRVSDLSAVHINDVDFQHHLSAQYTSNDNYLKKTKIEVSFPQNDDYSKYVSKGFDLECISAAAIYEVKNLETTFYGDKTFTGNVKVEKNIELDKNLLINNGDVTINTEGNDSNTFKFYGKELIAKTSEINLSAQNNYLNIGDNIELCSTNKIDANCKNVNINASGDNEQDGNITIDASKKITLKVGNSSLIIEPNKITLNSPQLEFNYGGSGMNIQNTVNTNNTKVMTLSGQNLISFPTTTASNPLTGYINHALWS